MTRPLITTDPTHEGAEQPMSDLERTAAISDAHHEGFGHGVAWADEDRTEAITAAEQRGYDRAIANLRTYAEHHAHPAGELAAELREAIRHVEAERAQP